MVSTDGRASTSLQVYAAATKADVIKRLRKAMRTIEQEIEQHEGVYPGGRLTQAELCRRAGIAPATLQKPTHKTTTLPDVQSWLNGVTVKLIAGEKNVRRAVTDRVTTIKAAYEDLLQSYHEAELEFIEAQNTIQSLTARLTCLEERLRNCVCE